MFLLPSDQQLSTELHKNPFAAFTISYSAPSTCILHTSKSSSFPDTTEIVYVDLFVCTYISCCLAVVCGCSLEAGFVVLEVLQYLPS